MSRLAGGIVAACLALSLSTTLHASERWEALDAKAVQLIMSGELAVATDIAQQAVAEARTAFGESAPQFATSLSLLGEIHMLLEQWPEAEAAHREALALREKAEPRDTLAVEESTNLLALVRRAQGELDEAERLHRQSVESATRAAEAGEVGPNSPRWVDITWALGELAETLRQRGNTSAAKAAQSDRLAALLKYGSGEPSLQRMLLKQWFASESGREDSTAAQAIVAALLQLVDDSTEGQLALAEALHLRARLPEPLIGESAESLRLQALAAAEKALAPDDPRLAPFLAAAGDAYFSQSAVDAAADAHRRALALYARSPTPDQHAEFRSTTALASLLELQTRHAEAESLRRRGVELGATLFGSEPSLIASYRFNLAENLRMQHRYADAAAVYSEVLTGYDPDGDAHESDRIESLQRLTELSALLGRFEQAAQCWAQLVALRIDLLGPQAEETQEGRRELAALQRLAGIDPPESFAPRRTAPASADLPAWTRRALVRSLDAALANSLPARIQALEAESDDRSTMVADLIVLRGELLAAREMPALAAAEYEKALSVRILGQGATHPDTRRTVERLAALYDEDGQPKRAAATRAKAGLR